MAAVTPLLRPTPIRWLHVALYLGLALVLAQLHAEWVNFGPKANKRWQRHEQILQGDGEAPWTYRVAVPWAAHGIGQLLQQGGLPPKRTVEYGYIGLRWLFTFALFLLFHRYVGHWLPPPWPLMGTTLLAALHGPAFAFYWFQPASALDLLLWTACAVLTLERRWVWLFPLIALGAVNRETSVFIVLLHGALLWKQEPLRPVMLRMLGLAGCWAVPTALVRFAVGSAGWAHGSDPLGMLMANLTHPDWILYALCFWGVAWVLPVWKWRCWPARLQALSIVLLPYLGLQFAFGRIREVRLFLPLALLLVPMLLLALRERPEERG